MRNPIYPLFRILAVLILLVFSHQSFSQRLSVFKVPKFKRDHTLNYIMATGGIGMSNYFGDLCSDFSCWTFQPSASLGGYWRYNERFVFRGEFYWSRLTGKDVVYSSFEQDPRWGRNASFRTDIFELSVGATYDIFDFNPIYSKRAFVEPYLMASIGILNFNPMAQYKGSGDYYNLHDYKTEGVDYSRWAVSFPIGVGCRFKVTDKLNAGVEIGYRITTTDYLDDVSNKYRKDVNNISDPIEHYFADRTYDKQQHTAGELRGNPNNRDGYIVYSLKVEYLVFVTKQLHERGQNLNADIDSRYKKHQIRRR